METRVNKMITDHKDYHSVQIANLSCTNVVFNELLEVLTNTLGRKGLKELELEDLRLKGEGGIDIRKMQDLLNNYE